MNKKNNRQKNAGAGANPARAIKRWVLFILVAPAVIFLFYWFAGRSSGPEHPATVPLPRHYHSAGATVRIGGITSRVDAGGTPALSRSLNFGINTVMAGAGEKYAVVAVRVSGKEVRPADWRLIDERGAVFPLLKITGRNPLPGQTASSTAGESYLIFRVGEKTRVFYIQYTGPGGPVAWRIS